MEFVVLATLTTRFTVYDVWEHAICRKSIFVIPTPQMFNLWKGASCDPQVTKFRKVPTTPSWSKCFRWDADDDDDANKCQATIGEQMICCGWWWRCGWTSWIGVKVARQWRISVMIYWSSGRKAGMAHRGVAVHIRGGASRTKQREAETDGWWWDGRETQWEKMM